jgi:hypothetical protein
LGLSARLKRLEDVGETQRARVKHVSPALELHCKLVDNARRRLQGLLPEPLTPRYYSQSKNRPSYGSAPCWALLPKMFVSSEWRWARMNQDYRKVRREQRLHPGQGYPGPLFVPAIEMPAPE